MNTIIYTRCATIEQMQSLSALDKQKELLRAYCTTNEIRITNHFEEMASGPNFNRIEWKKLIEFITVNKVDRILVTSGSRLGRNFHEVNATINSLSEMNIDVMSIQSTDFNYITFLNN